MGCLGSNDQACGGEFIIAVYQFNPVPLQDCDDTKFFTPFQLNAVFIDEPATSVPITMTSLIVHTTDGISITDAGILSVCSFQALSSSAFFARSFYDFFLCSTVQAVPIQLYLS